MNFKIFTEFSLIWRHWRSPTNFLSWTNTIFFSLSDNVTNFVLLNLKSKFSMIHQSGVQRSSFLVPKLTSRRDVVSLITMIKFHHIFGFLQHFDWLLLLNRCLCHLECDPSEALGSFLAAAWLTTSTPSLRTHWREKSIKVAEKPSWTCSHKSARNPFLKAEWLDDT